ncbi:MAG: T9SS type A sorting domain-containing protein [Bacteroidetes bacterium]|nr:T9SS type A sorting domain-containing protein [Bacteroidota bacterium]
MYIYSFQKSFWGIIPILMFFFISTFNINAQINSIGSFEQGLPSYWTKGTEPAGATLSWAKDSSRSMGRSLKIEKDSTSEAAMWESENMVDLWSDKHFKDVDIKFGMYYMTSGVNTGTSLTDDEKWYVSFTFYREDGSVIGETKFELDQTAASTGGWVADTTAVGAVILPEDSWTTIIRFVGGKDATGTVWTDDYIFVGRDGWAGQDWNTALGIPTGWFYWLPPIGGNDGILTDGYENTIVTDEFAYHGQYSLKFDMLEGTHDGFVGTIRYALNSGGAGPIAGSVSGSNDITALDGVGVGDVLRISVWIKGENLLPDSALVVGDPWTIAITPIFHTTLGNNEGFGDYWASDIPLTFPNATAFDWTQFYVDVTVPEPPAGKEAKSITIRLHPLGRWQGTVWMDALEIKKIGGVTDVEDATIPIEFSVSQNYPNPFNPSTTIRYAIPQQSFVVIKVYDIIGREVKTLVNTEKSPGIYNVQWNGDNNFGSKVATGIYIYRVIAGNFTQVKKMILLK